MICGSTIDGVDELVKSWVIPQWTVSLDHTHLACASMRRAAAETTSYPERKVLSQT